MKILVTNDDGIESKGIAELAQFASAYGEVTVIAPDRQCSAASHRITLTETLEVLERDFPVPVAKALSVSGSPADCVRVAVLHLMKDDLPDVIFSGINDGYNAGFDIAYSGTVGAAMEGVMSGIPSYAFSVDYQGSFDVFGRYSREIIDELISRGSMLDGIWNINFPGCPPDECRGVLWDRRVARSQFYIDGYREAVRENHLELHGKPIERCDLEETDLNALLAGYVSVGFVGSPVL